MESGNGGASSKGVLIPVSESTDLFQSDILAQLQSAYLYEESKQFFRYTSAVLVKNPELEEKYNAFRAKREKAGYSEEDLKEYYGFLLFDDGNKANKLGETGVLTGNSTCTTLGDPSKGVYISMYSDCLDLNRWYHGKSGYIAIIRLTKGKVKNVVENYTQNLTEPSVGFDCHVSEQLPSVSAKTSSFLAFERTQYYIYELLGSNETAESPSAACPFAIVCFSYTDTKETLPVPRERSEVKKLNCNYLLWRGQLQIGSLFFNVELRSAAVAFCPAKLPPVVKIGQVTSMLDLQQLLPRAVFETCCTDEVFLDGLYCSVCEFVPSEAEETSSFSQLLWKIKEKDLALTIPLNDGGFLILLHSSHFLRYDDSGSTAPEALQGIFVFPESRVVRRDTKLERKDLAVAPEILQFIPVLSYAEGEVEKSPTDPSEELCDVLMQHMQTYATLINPGLAESPSREVSIFPDQYDVTEAHKHIYSSPEWTKGAWQNITSYLSKPASFQLPVSKVSEILAAGQEERREDLVDDVYICLSSPEETPASPFGIELEDRSSDQETPVNAATSVDLCIPSNASKVNPMDVVQNIEPNSVHTDYVCRDNQRYNHLTELNKTDDTNGRLLTQPASEDLPAELIVSITSAEQSVTDKTLSVVSTMSATKHNDFGFSGFSPTAKLQAEEANSLNDETDKIQNVVNSSDVTSLKGTKRRKRRRRRSRVQKRFSKPQKKLSKACDETTSSETVTTLDNTPSSQTVITPMEVDNIHCTMDEHSKKVDLPQLSKPSTEAYSTEGDLPQLSKPSKRNWRKFPRRKRRFGKLSRKKKVGSAAALSVILEEKTTDTEQQHLEHSVLMKLEACPLRKKTERWDIKPVISECGRILVPHGSTDFAEQVKSLKDKFQSTKNDECLEKMEHNNSVNALDTVEVEQMSSAASEIAVDETEVSNTKDGRNYHPQSVTQIDREQSILRQSEDQSGSVPLTLESNGISPKRTDTDSPLPQEIQEKQIETRSPEKCITKGTILLSRLKSVISKRKRKTDVLVTAEKTENIAQDCMPCHKKAKGDCETEALNFKNATPHSTTFHVNEVSKMLSVDPVFAYALGLAPKEQIGKVQRTEDQDTQQRKDSAGIHEQLRVLQRAPSIFPRNRRIKTLKKHQGISAENIKKHWWLHFQSPGCFTSEKHKNNDCTRDISNRKTIKKKVKTACSSADALNLLADLALSVNNDQGPPQPNPALERKQEESLKKCDLTKGLTHAEQESVLHALLRNPAARSIQPLASPAPSPLVGDSELGGLVSKEHAYSFPPSSSPLLGLPGTPLQVSPVSGSTGVLHHHHHQTKYDDGVQTLQPFLIEEDISEHKRSSEHPHRHKHRHRHRRKFRRFRSFALKDGSIQVTRQWQEDYDFSLDSKFTGDAKDKVIIRALHGPWDCSIKDTNEEARLIFHMWIGLFYSRSTARFFHVDSCLTHPYSEESDSLKTAGEMVSGATGPELKSSSSACLESSTDTSDPLDSEALDLSKKDTAVSESVVLDLSLRNSIAKHDSSKLQVNRKMTCVSNEQSEPSETLNSLKSTAELQDASTLQCGKKNAPSAEISSEVNEPKTLPESKQTDAPPEDVSLGHTDALPFKGDGKVISLQEEKESVPIQPETVPSALGSGQVSHECNEDGIQTNVSENSGTTENCLTHKDGMDSSSSETDAMRDDREEGDGVHTDEHAQIELKAQESCQIPCQKGNINPLKKFCTGDGSASSELNILCNINDEKLLLREEYKAVLPDQTDQLTGTVDCSATHTEFRNKDHLKEDGFDEKESCLSTAEVDQDLRDQPLPKMSDGPVKEDGVFACWNQANEELPLADNTNVTCPNLFSKGESSISKTPYTPLEIKLPYNDFAAEKNAEDDICLADKTSNQKAALPMCDGSSCSFNESHVGLSSPLAKDSVQTRDKSEVSDFSFNLSSNGHEDQEKKSTQEEENADKRNPEEPLQHQSHSPKDEFDIPLTTEGDLKACQTNDELDKSRTEIVIPFIGIDTSGINMVQPQVKVEEAVGHQEAIPFINETTNSASVLPNEVCSPFRICGKTTEHSSHKISLLDVRESHEPVILDSLFGSRCSTPSIGEKNDEHMGCSSPSSSISAFRDSEEGSNICKFPSRSSTPLTDDPPLHQKLQTSAVNIDPNLPHDLQLDLELRTLKVVQRLGKILSMSNPKDLFSQRESAGVKTSLEQNSHPRTKHISACLASNPISVCYKNEKTSNEEPPLRSSSNSKDLLSQSSDDIRMTPFRNKIEEILGKKLQFKNTKSSVPQPPFESDNKQAMSVGPDCHSYIPFISTDNVHKTTSQSNLNHESHSYNQRPIMAVKPSKSEECREHCFSKDVDFQTTHLNKRTTAPIEKYTTQTSMHLKTEAEEILVGKPDGLNDDHDVPEFSSKTSWLSNIGYSNSYTDEEQFTLRNPHCQGRNILKFNMIPLSQSVQSFEPTESYPEVVDENHIFLTHSLKKTVEQTTEDKYPKDYSDKSLKYHKHDGTSEDSHAPQPQTSLVCTVLNTGQKEAPFLEQVSKRCLQGDLTEASMEQECLIFSERMKNLLKRKKGLKCQQDSHDSLRLSCSSPVTVNFSSLEEQEDSLDFFNMSHVGQKIKIDLSDRKDLRDTTEEEKTLHSQSASNPMDHAGISDLSAECASLYKAKMDDICSIKKIPPRHKIMGMHQGYPRTQEPSKHFDFCDQMKKELDETFRSNLNAVVKKSCKTKYRFYLLVTSDDVFFVETKAHLEAEGHTAVQPKEFFLAEDNSSSLLIILRNEDIAEHISEVPDLLKLKMSPGVQFAGIDEPDDVVNLTHQELFTQGGFIMLNKTVLETLSLYDMKKNAEILQDLSRGGKWKWMLHYKDSRRWKENARLSAEANEKKQFLYWGQDTGILEVLPYHECDLVSKDQPDYLACLLRLQAQNISSRYTVFITDTTDSAFEKNGILTMTLNAFLTKSATETFLQSD